MRFKDALRLYQQALRTHPFKMNCIQTSLLVGTGDVIAQQVIEGRGTDHQISRTLRMALIGACIGPTLHGWYSTLGKALGESTSLARNLTKVAVDQTLFAPLCVGSFLSLIALLEGRDVKAALESDYIDVMKANYTLWPCVQVINFTLVPLYYRTLFVQSVAVGWNTYLASKVHREKDV
uniref:Mitochondrial inner membrane protein Mpv17 n=1 Tax=Lygus hesperus TaxID=30085 RepID=A0A0A9X1C9_LYGHE